MISFDREYMNTIYLSIYPNAFKAGLPEAALHHETGAKPVAGRSGSLRRQIVRAGQVVQGSSYVEQTLC